MKTCILLLFSLSLVLTVGAQICSDGSTPVARTVALTGVNSWDSENDASNEGGILNFGSIGDIVGIDAQNINFTPVGVSWCNEAYIKFNTNFGDVTGIYYTPSFIAGSTCTDLPSSTGLIDLDALGLTIPTDALGNIYWESFEGLDDFADVIDATFTSGTITLYHCPTGIILPLEILEFNVEVLPEVNRIFWSTQNEINSNRQIIERSINGIDDWIYVGHIESTGEGQTRTAYQLMDENPLPAAYYRLSEIDHQEVISIYETIYIERATDAFYVSAIHPNPVVQQIGIEIWTNDMITATIQIVDQLGKIVFTENRQTQFGSNSITLNVAPFQAGIYTLNVRCDYESSTQRFVVK